ncbi:hypothetical protein Ngar_c05460 [Candidatus Nitrososphaera gargensis Ga9.2]|uniref:Uncharacterized protein n=1 Tax=Nitrososphaera gargensis (strain Ga9.2) TaxID=1237085 RepID=K0IM07_NITGG|nr:hypothetical protein [Candidatus Nitrososphaera gargensis]AFU57489.1 hypothetical protein Ngar_c05460 [Candidatus Nitrososphaera gargensis Ga9.2]
MTITTMKMLDMTTPAVSRSGSGPFSGRRRGLGTGRTTKRGGRSAGYHEPTLPTIQMVEAAIKEAKEYPSKYKLWRSLPKSMQYQTLEKVLNYLEASNKIMIDNKDGAIIWVFADNPKLEKLLEESTRLL